MDLYCKDPSPLQDKRRDPISFSEPVNRTAAIGFSSPKVGPTEWLRAQLRLARATSVEYRIGFSDLAVGFFRWTLAQLAHSSAQHAGPAWRVQGHTGLG